MLIHKHALQDHWSSVALILQHHETGHTYFQNMKLHVMEQFIAGSIVIYKYLQQRQFILVSGD